MRVGISLSPSLAVKDPSVMKRRGASVSDSHRWRDQNEGRGRARRGRKASFRALDASSWPHIIGSEDTSGNGSEDTSGNFHH